MKREDAASPETDRRTLVTSSLVAPNRGLKELREYTLLTGDLYKRFPGGVLTRCIGQGEAQKWMTEVLVAESNSAAEAW